MIEAVNSVISNSSVAKVPAEQQSTVRSLSANPDKVQEVAQAPYVSPYISIDRNSSKAILQIRDSDTGDVLRQFPTEGQLKAYRSAQQTSPSIGAGNAETPSEQIASSSERGSQQQVSAPQIQPASVQTDA